MSEALSPGGRSLSPRLSITSRDSSSVSATTTSPVLPGGGSQPHLSGTSPQVIGAGLPPPIHIPSGMSPSGRPISARLGSGSPLQLQVESAISTGSSSGTPGPFAAGQPSASSMQAQRRVYRQRRKDPSCDACRERKVKCDATETSSCSECSSRNLKCQFTKETNRRMSSIKQVQDLERQLHLARREIESLHAMMHDTASAPVVGGPSLPALNLPAISRPRSRQTARAIPDLARVRSNIRIYGKGIFKPPPPYRHSSPHHKYYTNMPMLPPRWLTDRLLQVYYRSVHVSAPIVHWPTLQQECDEVYRAGSLDRAPLAWSSVFFAILSVAAVYSDDPDIDNHRHGQQFLNTARALIDVWDDDYSLDNVRASYLITLFLFELNLKSTAWIWLAAAVRQSQDIGIHCENGPWPVIVGEMHRRVWWAIYCLARQMALELGRPTMIDDAECSVTLPAQLEDHHITDYGFRVPEGVVPFLLMTPIIHVERSVSQMIKVLLGACLQPSTIASFEGHFVGCLTAFAPAFHPAAADPIEPCVLAALCHLQTARIVLHRHNLSIICPPSARVTAIINCKQIALESATWGSRAMAFSESSGQGANCASGMTCMHYWRCTLFLLLCGHFEAALTCIKLLSTLGRKSVVVTACGRHIAFFLQVLIEKRRQGSPAGRPGYTGEAGVDEELMAYVSGDAQAGIVSSWVWIGAEAEAASTEIVQGVRASSTGASITGHGSALTPAEATDWGGWERVEYLVDALAREAGVGSQGLSPSTQRATSAVSEMGSSTTSTTAGPPPAPMPEKGKRNDRMSLANII